MFRKALTVAFLGLALAGCSNRSSCCSTGPGSCADFQQSTTERVHFDYDSAKIRDDARQALDGQASWLAKYPNAKLLVEGHCDARGTREYNLGLGERRATAARDYLASKGVDAERIKVVSYGKERLAAEGDTDEVHALNRRAVSVVE